SRSCSIRELPIIFLPSTLAILPVLGNESALLREGRQSVALAGWGSFFFLIYARGLMKITKHKENHCQSL
ncbi:hypothetical protein, partial [Nostoc sp.]|uniref:hypothetical protein n=1 Tax=Nostoc sp. TaxID=1180 RepID=UPI002FF5ADAA